MKLTTKRTEVTIETETIVHMRGTGFLRVRCGTCDADRVILTLVAAAGIAGTSISEIGRLIDAGSLHSPDATGNASFVCGDSLFSHLDQK